MGTSIKHGISLAWDEENQRLTINGSPKGTLTAPGRPVRTILERGDDEPSDMFLLRIGQVVIQVAKGEI